VQGAGITPWLQQLLSAVYDRLPAPHRATKATAGRELAGSGPEHCCWTRSDRLSNLAHRLHEQDISVTNDR
jgi:hypothetical protein